MTGIHSLDWTLNPIKSMKFLHIIPQNQLYKMIIHRLLLLSRKYQIMVKLIFRSFRWIKSFKRGPIQLRIKILLKDIRLIEENASQDKILKISSQKVTRRCTQILNLIESFNSIVLTPSLKKFSGIALKFIKINPRTLRGKLLAHQSIISKLYLIKT